MNFFSKILRKSKHEWSKASNKLWFWLTRNVWFLRVFYETRETEAYVTFNIWFWQKVMGRNRHAYWPMHKLSTINVHKSIYVGIGSAPGLSPGCYIQGIGKVYIGNYVGIGPNVGILSGSHHVFDLTKYKQGVVRIGDYCWIGMNCVIMPDVELGEYTVVQAGSVVKSSFKEGYCVIGGNPATLIKKFPPESHHLFNKYEYKYKYHGYIPEHKFEAFRKKNLWV